MKGTIFYIGGFELPDKNAAALRVLANAYILRELGYKVVFIGVSKTMYDLTLERINDFDCYSIPYPNSVFSWVKFIFLKEQYLKVFKKYDNVSSVILYNHPSFSTIRMFRYLRKNNIKIYLDLTEWFKGRFKKQIVLDIIKSLDNYLRIKVLSRKVDGVISISKYFYEFFQKSEVTNHCIIPPLVNCDDEKWKRSFQTNRIRKYIYAGAAFSVKYSGSVKDRLDLVIEAFYKLHLKGEDFHFDVIGCNREDFLYNFPELKQSVNELKRKIIFHGKKEHSFVLEMLRVADFSIFIRDNTIITQAGFPSKFVESISIGLPVITNSNSNVKSYVLDEENGYLIDEVSEHEIIQTLNRSLRLSSSKIVEMKKNTADSKVFHFKNFEGILNNIIEF